MLVYEFCLAKGGREGGGNHKEYEMGERESPDASLLARNRCITLFIVAVYL